MSEAFYKAQEELKQFGLYLEDFNEWLGEPAPHKFIVLDIAGHHRAYANTIAGVRKALARETKALKTSDLKQVAELTQLCIFG